MSRITCRIVCSMILAGVIFSAAAGCNTVKGAGEDVKTGGEKVKEAAENVQEKMK